MILKEIKTNRTELYKAFPGGLAEICRGSGVPYPKDRAKAVEKAVKARSTKAEKDQSKVASPITLTEEQSKRIYGIMQLEGGKDPSVIIDDLLDRDYGLRKSMLTMQQTKRLVQLLDETYKRNWKPEEVADYVTTLYNCGIGLAIPPSEVKRISAFLEESKALGWQPIQTARYLADHSSSLGQLNKEIQQARILLNETKEEIVQRNKDFECIDLDYKIKEKELLKRYKNSELELAAGISILEVYKSKLIKEKNRIINELEEKRNELKDMEEKNKLIQDGLSKAEKQVTSFYALQTFFDILRKKPLSSYQIDMLIKELQALKEKPDDTVNELGKYLPTNVNYERLRERLEKLIMDCFGFNKRLQEISLQLAGRWLNQVEAGRVAKVEEESMHLKSENEEIKTEMSKAGMAMALLEALQNPEIVSDELFKKIDDVIIELSVLREYEDSKSRMKHFAKTATKPILRAVMEDVSQYIKRLEEDQSKTGGTLTLRRAGSRSS